MVGDIGIGGDNPIRIQSMTTTPTTDVDATVAQTISLVKAGCEIVRITAPTLADARALGDIKKKLIARGIRVPLVADIHFNPECAMEAVKHVEKIRINPGNYADSKAFKVKEYTDAEYAGELARIEERFTPLVLKCKELDRSMRIGVNHGSLSDRILNRYGDTPEGMVESALEFVRVCEKNGYRELILSMKSSNPKVVIAAYRLLAARMSAEGMDYPFHLGVTEAGEGEDGRIKSAIGIGSLLNDGIGDTIRVSLTEDPEREIPVALEIAKPYQSKKIPSPSRGEEVGAHVDNFYRYFRRPAQVLAIGPVKLGGTNVPRVFVDVTEYGAGIQKLFKSSTDVVPEILVWTVASQADLHKLQECWKLFGGDTARCGFLGRFQTLDLAREGMNSVHATTLISDRLVSAEERTANFKEFIRAAKAANVSVMLESGRCHRGPLEPARNMLRGIEMCEKEGHHKLLLTWTLPTQEELIANIRLAAALLREQGKDYPIHLQVLEDKAPSPLEGEGGDGGARIAENEPPTSILPRKGGGSSIYAASVVFGSLLCDGIGDSVQVGGMPDPAQGLELAYSILQAAGARVTRTEYISCPSCGRTLFDLQSTIERIKSKTCHLKGVKIAIMGCIVNGPGEMADSDFGYVGGAPGKINLYVGRNCVEKGIPSDRAVDKLVELIKTHGKWVDPSAGFSESL